MKPRGSPMGAPGVNDGIAIRIQGIRTLGQRSWTKGPIKIYEASHFVRGRIVSNNYYVVITNCGRARTRVRDLILRVHTPAPDYIRGDFAEANKIYNAIPACPLSGGQA